MAVIRNYTKILKELTLILTENGYDFTVGTKVILTENDYNSDDDDAESIRKKKMLVQTQVVKDIKEPESKEPDVEKPEDEKKKGTRKAPSKPAKSFEDGYEMVSENDKRTYVVKTMPGEKAFKRWVLKK
jgi:hypothetical protein